MCVRLAMVVRDPPVRWRNVIEALRDAGFSLRDIASALVVAHTTVQRWLDGSCPNYEDGRALMKFFDSVRNCVPPTRIS